MENIFVHSWYFIHFMYLITLPRLYSWTPYVNSWVNKSSICSNYGLINFREHYKWIAAKCALILFFVGLYRITWVSLMLNFAASERARVRKSDFHEFTKQLFINFVFAMMAVQGGCVTENAMARYPSFFFPRFHFPCGRNMQWHEGVTEEASPWIWMHVVCDGS